MAIDVSNPYVRNQVLTASPEQLRMLLLDGCLRFAREGRDGLQSKNFEQVFEGFSNAKNILLELVNALRHDVAPELCSRLEGLYMYMFRQLTEASLRKDASKADEVIELLEYECETWRLLLEKMVTERGEDDTPAALSQADVESAQPAAPPARMQSLSLEG